MLQKKRAVLTVAAIAWGTVAILLLLAFGEGLKRQLEKNRKGMGVNLAVIWPGETSRPWNGLPAGRPIRPIAEDVAYPRQRLPDLEGLLGEVTSWSTSLTYGKTTVTSRVTGANWEYGEMRHHFPQSGGRFLNATDEKEKRRVIFLGNKLAKDIFAKEDPVGKIAHGERFALHSHRGHAAQDPDGHLQRSRRTGLHRPHHNLRSPVRTPGAQQHRLQGEEPRPDARSAGGVPAGPRVKVPLRPRRPKSLGRLGYRKVK